MIETLKEALTKGLTVSFVYDERPRIVEVHAVGHSTKDASLVMRGFQVAGESSRPLPGWALFTLAKVDALSLSPSPLSEAPRPGYAMNDKQMREVLFQIETADAV